MAGYIIYLVIMCLTALIMIGIGVSQLKSRKPVGFYTGVKPPEEKGLRNVKMWNRKHGIMWILYGCAIIGCGLVHAVAGTFGCSEALMLVVEIVVFIGGIFVMMWYHLRLERRYHC